ncbi:MAG: hypothetical protein KHY31_16335 [Clostridiales bacterium]|nr:hypothetical protein [Clostridiales bacterium]
MEREVAILTMSSKNGGYCVAGIDVENGKWIRLVSNDNKTHGALSNEDIKYQNGQYCKPLDLVQIPIIRNAPLEHQPENVLIDSSKYWRKVRTLTLDDVLKMHPVEYHFFLLGNQYAYITEAGIGNVDHSLIIVEVSDLTVEHPTERSTKATFTYRGVIYKDISVTDRDFYSVPNLWYTKKAVLVMSLPDAPYNGNWYYKFIAKIFPI